MHRELIRVTFLLLVLALAFSGCRKDDEDDQDNNSGQDIRTSEYSFTVSGDFDGEYELVVTNNAGVSGGVAGVYDAELEEFGLVLSATGLPDNGSWGLEIFSLMSELSVGNYEVSSAGISNFQFADNSGGVSFEVNSGTLVITDVAPAPVFAFGAVSSRYISGTFSLEMSNDEGETATASGQITDGVIVIY
jgi:hypothetical protein